MAKIRATYGVSGNISRRANAVTVIRTYNEGYTHNLPTAELNSVPNANLSWEKVKQFNIGLDFSTRNQRIAGTIEYYQKTGTNLLAQTPVDPTYGVSSMYMNVADMKGSGLDVELTTTNLEGEIYWQTHWIYSHNATRVTNYLMPIAATGRTYTGISLANPLV